MDNDKQREGDNHTIDELSGALSEISAALIHDISTPLAIVKVNCEFITRYLPLLLECHQKQAGATPIPAAHLDALAKSPEVVIEQVTLVQQRALRYWRELDQTLKDCAAPGGTSDPQAGTSLTMLCIAGDIALQDAALKILTPAHTVEIAVNGREAIKKCAETAFDVVLLDTGLVRERFSAAALKQSACNEPLVIGLTDETAADSDEYDSLLSRHFQIDELYRCLAALDFHQT